MNIYKQTYTQIDNQIGREKKIDIQRESARKKQRPRMDRQIARYR